MPDAIIVREQDIVKSQPVDCQAWISSPSWDRVANPVAPAPVLQDIFLVPPGLILLVENLGIMTPQLGEVADSVWIVQGRNGVTLNGGNLGLAKTVGWLRTELLIEGALSAVQVQTPLSWLRGSAWPDYARAFQENTRIVFRCTNWFECHANDITGLPLDHSGDIIVIARLTGRLVQVRGDYPPSSTEFSPATEPAYSTQPGPEREGCHGLSY